MAKRFTATDKWRDKWFWRLQPEYKLLWIYILDNCTNAGIWEVDLELAQMFTGFNYELKTAEIIFRERIVLIDDKWFIPKFIEFQYSELTENCKPHIPVIKELKRYNLLGYSKGIDTLKEKDKEKDKEKERVVESSSEPTINDVKQFFKSQGFDIKQAENFYSYYSAQNWETTSGMNIKKTWQKKVIGWMNNQKQFTKYEKNERPPQPVKEKFCFCGKEAVLWSDGIAGCSYVHCLEGKKLKKGEIK